MKALLLVDELADKIRLADVEIPQPKAHEVLVKIKAAALNRRDQWMREDMYPNIQYGTVLGSDGAGIVERIGMGVSTDWLGKEVIINPNIDWGDDLAVQSGDYHVLGMPVNGTLAEYVVVGADRLCEKPGFLTWEESASIPLAGLTAYRAVFTHGKVSAGKNVLISGVGGGVAQFAFLFAVAAGAHVFVTSGSQGKIDTCLQKGAKVGFNYKDENWQKEAKESTGGFDVVIDSAGGDQLNDFIKMMKPAGKIVFYGATNGLPKKVDLFRMFWNQVTLQGSTMGNDREFEDMVRFIIKHQIRPVIDSVRPIDKVVSAFDEMKAGKQFGKMVIGF